MPAGAATDSTATRFRDLMEAWRFTSAESLAAAELAAAEAQDGYVSPRAARALEWRSLAKLRGCPVTRFAPWWPRQGEADSAVAWARRAVAIREGARPADTLALARSLIQLGRALNQQQQFTGRSGLARALELCERARGPESLECAEALFELGKSGGWQMGLTRSQRRPLVERALRIRERLLGPDHPDVARCLLVLAPISSAPDSAEAPAEDPAVYPLDYSLPMLLRAREIFERTYGPEHPLVGRALEVEAKARFLRRERAEGDSCHGRALRTYEQALGPVSVEAAELLLFHGLSLSDLGEYDEAVVLLRHASQELDSLDAGWRSRWSGYNCLGMVLFEACDYTESVRWMERQAALSEQRFASFPRIHVYSLVNLESPLQLMGDYPRFVEVNCRTVALMDSLGMPETEITLQSRIPMHFMAGDTTRTLALLDSLFALYGRGGGRNDDYQELLNQTFFAGIFPAYERYRRAQQEYRRIDEAFARSHSAECATHGLVVRDRAEMFRRSGDLAAADSTARRALAMLERRLGARHPEVSRARLVLAGILRERGRHDAAFAMAREAESDRLEHVRVVTRASSEAQALRFAATQPSGLGMLLTLAASDGDVDRTREAWDALVRSRGLVQDEVAMRQHRALAGDACAREYEVAVGRYARLLVRGPAADPGDSYLRELTRAREQSEQAERELATTCDAAREEGARSRTGLEEALGVLAPEDALVGYARVPADQVLAGSQAFEPFVSGPSAEANAMYVALVKPAGREAPRAVNLGRAGIVDSLVAAWRAAAGSPPIGQTGAEIRYRAAAGALRRAVWDPLRPDLAGARRVFVVPDGAISLVSLATLCEDDGRYLVESGPTLHCVSAERDLASPRLPGEYGSGLLAVGDPEVHRETSAEAVAAAIRGIGGLTTSAATSGAWAAQCGALHMARWGRLPGARREIDEIAGEWNRSGDGHVARLVAAEGTEARVKMAAPGHRVLHLATHGFVLPADCVWAGVGQPLGLLRGALRVVDPFGLSGLVLAGGNRRGAGAADEEDGVLLAQEIATLDLSGVEWAVLSACETGLGEVLPGEGVYGLRRAFQVAGARTLIMSLWSVEDEATRVWMGHLYRARLEEKKDTAESVRAASLAVLAERRANGLSTHPFWWGAFVAAGDWR